MRLQITIRWGWWLAGFCALVLLLAAAAFLQKDQIRAWHYVHGLVQAKDSEREVWVERVVDLDNVAIPWLLGCLYRQDSQACENAQLCLTRLVKRWGLEDPRSVTLTVQLAEAFPSLSPSGQRFTLEFSRSLGQLVMGKPIAPSVVRAQVVLVHRATAVTDAAVRARALELADVLLMQGHSTEVANACRLLAVACLRDAEVENRAHALRLAIDPRIGRFDQVVPLLRDPKPEIRRSAMMAVGPVPEAIATDDLLYWLNDSDADVRHLCEGALRGRGLQESHLKIGRLMTDERPSVRLEVLDRLRRSRDLEPGVWLRRLSRDPAPAVRAATLRVVAEQTCVDLADRIEQMAQDDPSLTIRQLARYYLSCRKAE